MRPFVIKLGGACLDQDDGDSQAWDGFAALLRRDPAIVVHGGGAAVDRQLQRLGLASQKHEGIRITPQSHMDQITGVLAGQMNTRLIGLLLSRGIKAVGLTLGDGLLTRSQVTTKYSFDAGRVGEVIHGDMTLLHTLIASGFVPVVCSIAIDSAGDTLNVNADEAAAAMARLVPASRLVFLTDVAGVMDAQGRIVKSLTAEQCQKMMDRGELHGGMVAKVRSALDASQSAGVPVTVAGWSDATANSSTTNWHAIGTQIQSTSQLEAIRA